MFKFVRSILLCTWFIAQSYVYANALREIFNEEEALKLYSICQKISPKNNPYPTPSRLLRHNDRDSMDCSETYCFCKELSERPISRKEEKEAIEAIKCISDHLYYHRECIIFFFKNKLDQEDIDFLNEFESTSFIEKIDRIVLRTKLEFCVIL